MERSKGLDGLRALALLFALQAHFGFFLLRDFSHPVVLIGYILGGLAAPLFLFVSGYAVSISRHDFLYMFRRGVMLILIGFVLNLLIGVGFCWGILQTIGICGFLLKAMMRFSEKIRISIAFAMMLLSSFLPLNGWFLPFPWFSFMLLGSCPRTFFILPFSIISVIYREMPNIFPPNSTYMFLTAIGIIILFRIRKKLSFLHALGRLTLTIYFLHMLLVFNLKFKVGLVMCLNIIFLVMLFFFLISKIWKRFDYAFSLEWLVRQISKE